MIDAPGLFPRPDDSTVVDPGDSFKALGDFLVGGTWCADGPSAGQQYLEVADWLFGGRFVGTVQTTVTSTDGPVLQSSGRIGYDANIDRIRGWVFRGSGSYVVSTQVLAEDDDPDLADLHAAIPDGAAKAAVESWNFKGRSVSTGVTLFTNRISKISDEEMQTFSAVVGQPGATLLSYYRR